MNAHPYAAWGPPWISSTAGIRRLPAGRITHASIGHPSAPLHWKRSGLASATPSSNGPFHRVSRRGGPGAEPPASITATSPGVTGSHTMQARRRPVPSSEHPTSSWSPRVSRRTAPSGATDAIWVVPPSATMV